MFDQVSLGLHEQNLRRMILEGDPGRDSDYSVILGTHKDASDHRFPIANPILRRHSESNVRYFHSMLGTFVTGITVDMQVYGELWREFVLKDGARFRFLFFEPLRTSQLYKH